MLNINRIHMDIINRLKGIFRDVLKINDNIEYITIMNNDNWDSLAHISLIAALEEEFEFNIHVEDIIKIYNDFDSVLNYIIDRRSK